ncbi:hypothetical protein BVRB_6g131250 [Beta vulgaris subsp. vulgaris]|nr:hypothetical protein BVRB_6g131250 [Beta vulgaris subsp. vulgaris]
MAESSKTLGSSDDELPPSTSNQDHQHDHKADKICYVLRGCNKTLKLVLSKPNSSPPSLSYDAQDTNQRPAVSIIDHRITTNNDVVNNNNNSNNNSSSNINNNNNNNNNNSNIINNNNSNNSSNNRSNSSSNINKRLRRETSNSKKQLNNEEGASSSSTKAVGNDESHDVDMKLGLLLDHLHNVMDITDVTDAKIIFERELFASDIEDQQGRLSIPEQQLLSSFLTQEEFVGLQHKDDHNKNAKIHVKVIIGNSKYDLHLSRWNYKGKDPRFRYALKHGWTKLVEDDNLKKGQRIRLVSFRSNNQLHIVIQRRRILRLFGTDIEVFD